MAGVLGRMSYFVASSSRLRFVAQTGKFMPQIEVSSCPRVVLARLGNLASKEVLTGEAGNHDEYLMRIRDNSYPGND